MGYQPDITPLEVKDIILESVDKFPQLENLFITGGRLNVNRAMQLAENVSIHSDFVIRGLAAKDGNASFNITNLSGKSLNLDVIMTGYVANRLRQVDITKLEIPIGKSRQTISLPVWFNRNSRIMLWESETMKPFVPRDVVVRW